MMDETTRNHPYLRLPLLILLALGVGVVVSPASPRIHAAEEGQSSSLFQQSARVLLEKEFASDDVSYLLLDAQQGTVLALHWDDANKPVPMGSLIKPFTAMAYARSHANGFPKHFCAGKNGGCWLPAGHGNLSIEGALANSCNAYFRQLAEKVSPEQFSTTANDFGLPSGHSISQASMIGLGDDWQVSPNALSRAFLDLVRHHTDPATKRVLTGLQMSGRSGTGKAVGRHLHGHAVLVKTGTAVCTHSKKAPGDGFALIMTPADSPRLLLLVRVHGVPGAKSAYLAGRMLERLGEGQ